MTGRRTHGDGCAAEAALEDRSPTLLRRVLGALAGVVVAFYVLLDGLVRPVFGPIMRWLSRLQIVRRLERAIAALPAYVILVLLVVPFGIAELAKVYAVVLMGEGHFRTGAAIFVAAYVVSILVCERTFRAGQAKLMTIGWFAFAFRWIMAVKDRIVGWLQATRAWAIAMRLRADAKTVVRRLETRLRALFGMRPRPVVGRRP